MFFLELRRKEEMFITERREATVSSRNDNSCEKNQQ